MQQTHCTSKKESGMIDKYKKARVHFTGALLLALSATVPARADYQSTVLSQGPSATGG